MKIADLPISGAVVCKICRHQEDPATVCMGFQLLPARERSPHVYRRCLKTDRV
jgi:hypothetical protein